MTEIKQQKAKICFLATAAFSLVANAFAYFNLTPHHDAIHHMLLFSDDGEISVGRFLHPVWGELVGSVTMPWFTGLLSILFLSITVWFCTDLLNIRSKAGIILTSGFLSVNYSIAELCGTFGYVLGAYTFALMLICAAVWMVANFKRKTSVIAAAVLICISMGLYQAYITVGFTLFLILVMQQTVSWNGLKFHFREWIRFVVPFVAGGILYLIIYKIVLHFTGIEIYTGYNSLTQLSRNLDIRYLVDGAIMIYKDFIRLWFLNKAPSTWLIALVNLTLIITAVVVAVSRIMKQEEAKAIRILLFFLCVVLFPLASTLMSLLMHNTKMNFLVSYAVFLFYPGCISLIEMNGLPSFSSSTSEKSRFTEKRFVKVLCLACSLVLFSFVRFSNGAYSISKVIYDRTITAVTTIMVEMDATEGYLPGETEVVVIGRLDSKESSITSKKSIDYFKKALTGYKKVAITYPQTFERYFHLMGHPINMIHKEAVVSLYENNSTVREMPCYPVAGYCRMVDGRMVVKFAEKK